MQTTVRPFCEICNKSFSSRSHLVEHFSRESHKTIKSMICSPIINEIEFNEQRDEILYSPPIVTTKFKKMKSDRETVIYRGKPVTIRRFKDDHHEFLQVQMPKGLKKTSIDFMRETQEGEVLIAREIMYYCRRDKKMKSSRVWRMTDAEGLDASQHYNNHEYEVKKPNESILVVDVEYIENGIRPAMMLARIKRFLCKILQKLGCPFREKDLYVLKASRMTDKGFKHSYHIINDKVMFMSNTDEFVFKQLLLQELASSDPALRLANGKFVIDESTLGRNNGQMRLLYKSKLSLSPSGARRGRFLVDEASILKLVQVPIGVKASEVKPRDLLCSRYSFHKKLENACYFNVYGAECLEYMKGKLKDVLNVSDELQNMSKDTIVRLFKKISKTEGSKGLLELKYPENAVLNDEEVEKMGDLNFSLELIPNNGPHYQTKSTWLQILFCFRDNGGSRRTFAKWTGDNEFDRYWNMNFRGDSRFIDKCLYIIYGISPSASLYEELLIRDFCELRKEGWEVEVDEEHEVLVSSSEMRGAWDLKKFMKYKIIVIDALCAAGKSHLAAMMIEELKKQFPDLTVLYLTLRRSQADDAVYKLSERTGLPFASYLPEDDEEHPDISGEDKPFVICSCESIHKVKKRKFNLVIIDELTSALAQMTSPTMFGAKPFESFDTFENVVAGCDYFFGADAFISPCELQFVKDIKGGGEVPKSCCIFNLRKTRFPRKLTFFENVSNRIVEESRGALKILKDVKRSKDRKGKSIGHHLRKWKRKHAHFRYNTLETAMKASDKSGDFSKCIEILEDLKAVQGKPTLLKHYFESLARGIKCCSVFSNKSELESFMTHLKNKLHCYKDLEHFVYHSGIDDKKKRISNVTPLWGKPNAHQTQTSSNTVGIDMLLKAKDILKGLTNFQRQFMMVSCVGPISRDLAQSCMRVRVILEMFIAMVDTQRGHSPVVGINNVREYLKRKAVTWGDIIADQQERYEAMSGIDLRRNKNWYKTVPNWYKNVYAHKMNEQFINARPEYFVPLLQFYLRKLFGQGCMTFTTDLGQRFDLIQSVYPPFDELETPDANRVLEIDAKITRGCASQVEKIVLQKHKVMNTVTKPYVAKMLWDSLYRTRQGRTKFWAIMREMKSPNLIIYEQLQKYSPELTPEELINQHRLWLKVKEITGFSSLTSGSVKLYTEEEVKRWADRILNLKEVVWDCYERPRANRIKLFNEKTDTEKAAQLLNCVLRNHSKTPFKAVKLTDPDQLNRGNLLKEAGIANEKGKLLTLRQLKKDLPKTELLIRGVKPEDIPKKKGPRIELIKKLRKQAKKRITFYQKGVARYDKSVQEHAEINKKLNTGRPVVGGRNPSPMSYEFENLLKIIPDEPGIREVVASSPVGKHSNTICGFLFTKKKQSCVVPENIALNRLYHEANRSQNLIKLLAEEVLEPDIHYTLKQVDELVGLNLCDYRAVQNYVANHEQFRKKLLRRVVNEKYITDLEKFTAAFPETADRCKQIRRLMELELPEQVLRKHIRKYDDYFKVLLSICHERQLSASDIRDFLEKDEFISKEQREDLFSELHRRHDCVPELTGSRWLRGDSSKIYFYMIRGKRVKRV